METGHVFGSEHVPEPQICMVTLVSLSDDTSHIIADRLLAHYNILRSVFLTTSGQCNHL